MKANEASKESRLSIIDFLKLETDGYLKFDKEGNLIPIEVISKESQEKNELLKSKILVK